MGKSQEKLTFKKIKKYQNKKNIEKPNKPIVIKIVPKEQLLFDRNRFITKV